MGHIHLGVLPRSRKWKAVVALLGGGAADGAVIAQSAAAAERELSRAAYDPQFVETLRLLAMIPTAARSDRFGAELRGIGLDVGDAPDFPELIAAVSRRLDRHADDHGRSDFGELSRRALMGALSSGIGDRLPSLFGAEPEDVRRCASRLSHPDGFSGFARTYFNRLLADTLSSWLDRALVDHVGPGRRFAHVGDRAAFDAALVQHCAEASRIIKEFAAGWHAATLRRVGAIGTQEATVFGAVAFKKILEELRRGRDDDA